MKKLAIIFLLLSSIACWALPQCRGNNPDVWNNCYGEATDYEGSRYIGGWKNGLQHGNGYLRLNDRGMEGDIYSGDFVNGKL